MTAPPTTAELRRRLVSLWFDMDRVPPERRLQAMQLIERLEQMTDDEDRCWAF